MDDEERRRQPRTTSGAGRTAGGIAVTLAVLAAKFKAFLAAALSFKGIFLGTKFLLTFGSMFLSIAVYAALFGGWKIAIVFVLMILVHELGHYLTWRNLGVQARLPVFIPLLGAFTAAPPTGTPPQNVAATLAGPAFGIAAAAACWGYGFVTREPFWYGAAYIGFFLNFFNLIPMPPFDGGRIAQAIDARLWLIGFPLFLAWLFLFGASGFVVLFIVFAAFSAWPMIRGVWRGTIPPRMPGFTPGQRTATAIAYFALALAAIAGAAATIHGGHPAGLIRA